MLYNFGGGSEACMANPCESVISINVEGRRTDYSYIFFPLRLDSNRGADETLRE